jgi:site-specific DNA-methyltransferase (adenine-specific)
MIEKGRSKLNKTIILSEQDTERLSAKLVHVNSPVTVEQIKNVTIHQDTMEVIRFLPERFVDLLFLDPPYNRTKDFNGKAFKRMSIANYVEWLESWFSRLIKVLKPTASIYFCADWQSSTSVHIILEKYFTIRNRITWEREKGRGAKTNWKNASEDIWFATVSDKYTFNVDDVKLKRRVLAPYVDNNGSPKDWESTDEGDFRLTHPSNIWTDLSVPFWSMSENTNHPTQKPEKLLAKIILASTNKGDFVLDPFLGSGTTSVVAKKLGRKYCGIEIDRVYCCLAEKRLEMADNDRSIQGYEDGVFWERNTVVARRKSLARRYSFLQDSMFSTHIFNRKDR